MKVHALFQWGDDSKIVKLHLRHLKIIFSRTRIKFNQTCHKFSFGEGNTSLFKRRTTTFFKGKNALMTNENLLLQNHWADSNQTLHIALFVDDGLSFHKKGSFNS